MNARDLLNRADTIHFEGDAIRAWLLQLQKRAKGTLEAARKNKVIEKEWKSDRDELVAANKAIAAAIKDLDAFNKAVLRREGKK